MYKNMFSIMALLGVLAIFTGCEKDGNENTNKIKGLLNVRVYDPYQQKFLYGAEVYLYKSLTERTNDSLMQNYFRKELTDSNQTGFIGAFFSDLDTQEYFIDVRWKNPVSNAYAYGGGQIVLKKDTNVIIIIIGNSTVLGNLKIIACDQVGQYYMGGADVFLYKTMAERDNDHLRTAYYRRAITDTGDPVNIGAIFYELKYQKYYFYVMWTNPVTSRIFVGAGESFVPVGMTTQIKVDMQ
jgi:hypothetical protein